MNYAGTIVRSESQIFCVVCRGYYKFRFIVGRSDRFVFNIRMLNMKMFSTLIFVEELNECAVFFRIGMERVFIDLSRTDIP